MKDGKPKGNGFKKDGKGNGFKKSGMGNGGPGALKPKGGGGFKRKGGADGKPPGSKPKGPAAKGKGRPKGGVFLHKKGGKKAEKWRAAEAATAAGGGGSAAPAKPRRAVGAAVELGGTSGDADDFGHLFQEMEDYRPEADGGGGGGDGSGGSGSDGEGGPVPAPKRRKAGPKLSALEFEARREQVRQLAECGADEQADWLWASFQQQTAASALERGGLTADGLAPLPAQGSLEDRLKSLQPGGAWQQEFCGRGNGGQRHGGQQQGEGRPPGTPSLLLVSPSAIGAVNLIKRCPTFNQACRIGKLFAKHIKVAEQEAALRAQAVCVAAGTPNRLCKLADSGALKLGRLRHVVLDLQLDPKQRDILAIPETRADWWQFYQRHLAAPLAAGTLKLSLVNSDHLAS